jgi:hypothetical protein
LNYVIEESRWPTLEEIATITGVAIDHVIEVEKRLGGTDEFALRSGLLEESG